MIHDSGLTPNFVDASISSTGHKYGGAPLDRLPLLAWRPCPVCGLGETGGVVVHEAKDFRFFDAADPVTLTDVSCARCGTLYRNPTFTARGMDELFAKAGRSYGSAMPDERVTEQVAWMRARGCEGSILDYGCGDGRFLAAWPDGPKFGMDVDKAMLQAAAERSPDTTFICLRSDDSPEGQIPRNTTLFHALEHVEAPVYLLRSLGFEGQRSQFFQPRAKGHERLIVEVPILERGQTDDICGFFSPQHVTHFTKHTLLQALGAAGWSPLEQQEMPYNGFRVLCARAGYRLKPKSDPADWEHLCAYNAHRKHAIAKVNARLATIGVRNVIVWGGGMHTECLWQYSDFKNYPPAVIVDADPLKHGTLWRGVNITDLGFVDLIRDWASTCLLISSYGSQAEIKQAALARGIPESAIVTLYDSPVVY